jgi:hypothetical protein
MTQNRPFKHATTLASLGMLTLAILTLTWTIILRVSTPHTITCLTSTVNGTPKLYLGSPGAANVKPARCQFVFMKLTMNSFVQITSAKLVSSYELSPWSNSQAVDEADLIRSPTGSQLSCQNSNQELMIGGNLICSFGLWQLVPYSNGVVLRLQRGAMVTVYSLHPAPIPHKARSIYWQPRYGYRFKH